MTNEELLREAVEAFNREDRAAIQRLLAPDVELVNALSEIRGKPYEGHDGAYQWVDDLDATFDSFTVSVDEVEDVRGDRVLGLGRAKARGKNSEMDYERDLGFVMDISEGHIRKIWVFFDHEEARRSARDVGQGS
jgi:ketosteroid isomerase-like protein